MKKTNLLFLLITLAFFGCKTKNYKDLGDGVFADIQTNKGNIILKLHYKQTPITVANFVSLADGTNTFVTDSLKGKKYYDGIIFHRVIKDFMIQGGDPSGTGRFGPGYKFDNEIVDSLKHDKAGILSMANAGPGTNGSQFFITHKETPFLNGKHTVFGEVVLGLEIIDTIANVSTSKDPQTRDKPIDDIVINHVEIVQNGKEAKSFHANETITDYFAEAEEREIAAKKVFEELVAEFEAQKEKATETATGLKYFYLNKAEGAKPKEGQSVMVTYAGFFSDGKLFDSNSLEITKKYGTVNPGRRDQNGYAPNSMQVSKDASLIPGFKEALFILSVGDKARVFIPSHLAYGPTGYGGVIPPNADLIFDLEILSIVE